MKKHFFLSALLMAGLALAGFQPAKALDVVVDNDEGAPTFTTAGSWTRSSATGYNGGTYIYANAGTNATATWTPNLEYGGLYNVYAIVVMGSNRTTGAPYTIQHAGGTSSVSIDQRGTPEQYYQLVEIPLGSWTFQAGSSGSVSLSSNGASGVHIADAIRFVLLVDMPPLISDVRTMPYYPAASESVTVRARVVDDVSLQSVRLLWNASPSGASGDGPMFDDGAHDDLAAGDSTFAAAIPGLPSGEQVEFRVFATDNADKISSSPLVMFQVGRVPDIHLVVNEFLASNVKGATDPDFSNTADWIEIVNLGPDIADLGSFALSDSPTSPTRWRFPREAALAPGQYLVIWADGMNVIAKAMHTDFKLSADGESIILYDMRNHREADRVDFGPQVSDISQARIPDQTGLWIATEKPTPGGPNIYGKSGPAPVISVRSGIYAAPFQVEITAPNATEIRYTTNGSAPGPASALYSGPITISATAPLRARAWYSDLDPSPIASASYFLNPPADRTIPIMDVVIDPADFNGANGIYTNTSVHGLDWERPVHVMITPPDGSHVYEVEAGARLHGGYSRALAKKSLRLYFRSIYGPTRWSLPWMTRTPLDGCQQIVLRSGANDSFFGGSTIRPTYFRDQIMRDWLDDRGQRAADGFFVALHINGAYWGIYNATERITDSFMEDTFGGSDWDVVKGSWDSVRKYFIEAVDGDLAAWNQFIEWIENHNVATDADFQTMRSMLDCANFLDYFSLNIICQNHDWPHNNWIATRRRGDPTARWTFHEWDAEWSAGLNPTGWQGDTLTWARGNNYYLQRQYTMPPLSLIFAGNDIDPNMTVPINGLLDRPETRRDFIARVEETLNFELLPEHAIADTDRYAAMLQTEVPREAARWTSSLGISAATLVNNWNTGVSNMRAFLNNRPTYIRNSISSYFGLGGTQTISFTASGSGTGRLLVNRRAVNLPWSGVFFRGSTIALRPIPDAGMRFDAWSGLVQSANPLLDYTVQSTTAGKIDVKFEPAAQPLHPNDVIFNEYWLNDNNTPYASIENRAIDGDWIELLVIRDGIDLRGWRITNNATLAEGGPDSTGGSLIFPSIAALQSVPAGTFILIVSKISGVNASSFPADELDPAARRMIFYAGNGNLDIQTDPGFSIPTGNASLALLAPGATAEFSDDIGIDFIAEGADVTPASFGIAAHGVVFTNPFAGIGADDGAIFINDPNGGFVNDDGADANREDFVAGPGGWVLDPPKLFTGDDPAAPGAVNWLTPGARNHGQNAWPLPKPCGWIFF